MIERQITGIKKDSSGNIVSLCNPTEWWSPKSVNEILYDIEEYMYLYFVIVDGQKVEIKIITGLTKKYIRTDPDKTTKNNLEDLPAC
ncbi:MAG TPA: DUF3892 domain-containing protein [Ignavibacteriales bacterium]|nr:DUF3892 domain-containing protein [Ignavibacteriales bacterium]